MALNLSCVFVQSKHVCFLIPCTHKLYSSSPPCSSIRRAEQGDGRVTKEEYLRSYSGSLSSARMQLDLLEQLTSSGSAVNGYESDGSSGRPTIRDQLARLVGDRDDDFNIPLGKNLKKFSAKNNSTFFATIGAFVILPPVVILGIAIATGDVQLFP
ncbi:unnamed protein product [Withania somnifera]